MHELLNTNILPRLRISGSALVTPSERFNVTFDPGHNKRRRLAGGDTEASTAKCDELASEPRSDCKRVNKTVKSHLTPSRR